MTTTISRIVTVQSLHDRAMRACDRAIASRKKLDLVREFQQLRSALRYELMAAGRAAERRVSIQTIVILTRSAANINARIVDLMETRGANT